MLWTARMIVGWPACEDVVEDVIEWALRRRSYLPRLPDTTYFVRAAKIGALRLREYAWTRRTVLFDRDGLVGIEAALVAQRLGRPYEGRIILGDEED